MLSAQNNAARTALNLSGVWSLRIKEDAPWQSVAVPASYNDQSPDPQFRTHVGLAWYKTQVTVPSLFLGKRLTLRFDAVTHDARVFLNGELLCTHRGGFLPFEADITVPSMDVVSINRYYGWYNLSGDLPAAQYALRMELDHWQKLGKPVILSEYGADTVAGLHAAAPDMFTEEFQVAYYEAINACLDERPFVVGEMPWNFADFATQQGPMRAGGNRKGLFTRDRRPKMAAHYFKERWRDFRKGE